MSKIVEERIREILGKKGIDSFYISNPVNVRYVSGYTGDDSFLFLTQNGKYFITDARYKEQAMIECPDYVVLNYRDDFGWSVTNAITAMAEKEGVKSIGIEEQFMVVSVYQDLISKTKADILPLSGLVEKIRSKKTPEEINCLRASCDIASRAFSHILKDIRVGITEKELAANLSRYMVLEGADTKPYGNILISGTKTSLLHGIPTEKPIQYGDFVLMDYGCQYHGYLSDMTRTVVVGKANPKQREVYEYEQKMVKAMEQKLRAGADPKDVYEAGAAIIRNTEYFPYHYTGVGHGVGLFVHEPPFLSPTSNDEIFTNTVMTVEPGIYIPGWGGVRIEDQVLVTEYGHENLISAPKELIEL